MAHQLVPPSPSLLPFLPLPLAVPIPLFFCSLPFLPVSGRCLPGTSRDGYGAGRGGSRGAHRVRPSLGKHTRPSATAAALIKSAVARTSCPNPIPPSPGRRGRADTPARSCGARCPGRE